MLLLVTMAFTAMPNRADALLYNSPIKPIIEVSGSLGIRTHDAKCEPTFPNQTITSDERHDWCSNLAKYKDEYPWISYSFPHRSIKVRGYSVRNGCCRGSHFCCCNPEDGKILDFDCCCELYSFSLQGSNDNRTWRTLHHVEKDNRFRHCELKTYEFSLTDSYRFIRFIMDEEKPGCPRCLQINQIELYGETISSGSYYSYEDNEEENDETISIIGKVKRDVI